MKLYTDIFFDLDRTLWDFEKNSTETFKDIYTKYKLADYFDDFHSFHSTYKKINEDLWEQYRNNIISKTDLSWRRFFDTLKTADFNNEIIAKKIGQEYIDNSPLKTELYPHTLNTLKYLHRKYSLHIITNGFKEVQYRKLLNSKLSAYFEHIFVSEEIGINKPEPRFFEHALRISNASAEKSIVIGDDLHIDIIGANRIGIDSVWFNPNKSKNESLVMPTYEINSLKDLVSLL